MCLDEDEDEDEEVVVNLVVPPSRLYIYPI